MSGKVHVLICEDDRPDGGGVSCEGVYASRAGAVEAMRRAFERDKSDLSLGLASSDFADDHCHIEVRSGIIYYDISEQEVME